MEEVFEFDDSLYTMMPKNSITPYVTALTTYSHPKSGQDPMEISIEK
jgi:hypothetical protein